MMSERNRVDPAGSYGDEVDFRVVLQTLWAGKWIVGAATFLSALVATIVAILLPDIYRAEALLAPNDQDRPGGLSALSAQYGGLASLAGIDLGSGGGNKVSLGLEILKSRKFVSEFVERRKILVPLLAAQGWDSKSGEVIVDSGDYDSQIGKWIRDVSPPKKTIPSMQEAYEEFTALLRVKEDSKTGLVTLSIEHYSPIVAKQWVDWLVEDLNSTIMKQDVSEAEQAIVYLSDQIENTPLADLQSVFFSLIEEQTKTVMLAKVTNEYLLKTIDPAVAPEKKAKPKRLLIVVFGAVFGGFVGGLIVSFSSWQHGRKLDRPVL